VMVSNLPYAATVEDVEDFAAQAGTPLNVKIITDRWGPLRELQVIVTVDPWCSPVLSRVADLGG
jgi:hypothetical protein